MGAGDFSVIGAGLVLVGELLCEAVDLRAGQDVLDVATGFRNLSVRPHEELLRKYSGPAQKTFEALDAAGQEALSRDRLEIWHRFNRSGDETLVAPSDYLEVVAPRA